MIDGFEEYAKEVSGQIHDAGWTVWGFVFRACAGAFFIWLMLAVGFLVG